MKTLVIDDDPFELMLLGHQLAHLDCTPVLQIKHAREAVELLKAEGGSVGLVFCDLRMPDIDGVQFLRHLAHIGWRGSLVLVSGEDARVLHTAERLALGYGIHLLGTAAKPVRLKQLRKFIDQHEARRVTLSRAAPSRAALTTRSHEELRCAISARELVIHYQPKVLFATGALVGAEALVRWQHPQAGLVYPDQFIGVAEEHGLSEALTHFVLTGALTQLRVWLDAGLTLRMSVNVSMDNLAALDFPDQVAQAALAAGVPQRALILEVTESRIMKDVLTSLDILTRLRLKHIGLAIDDFGTGHSSLTQLRDLPFDELKLDHGFVSGAVHDASLAAIVQGTITMARQLGITATAEGVEDRSDWDFLRAHGCDIAQGYFIGRPMTGAAMQTWAKEWEQRCHELTLGHIGMCRPVAPSRGSE